MLHVVIITSLSQVMAVLELAGEELLKALMVPAMSPTVEVGEMVPVAEGQQEVVIALLHTPVPAVLVP